MSETPRTPLLSPIKRGVLAALLIVGVSAIIKDRVQRGRFNPAEARGKIRDALEAHHGALRAQVGEAKERDAKIKGLPTLTAWYPAAMPCGLHTVPAPALPADMQALHLAIKPGSPMTHQLRFHRVGDVVTWHARRDGDCDGLHEVHALRGDLSWTGALNTKIVTQNPGE